MRVVGLLLFVFIFIFLPFLLLQAVVMPALGQLQYTYQNVDSISQSAVQQ